MTYGHLDISAEDFDAIGEDAKKFIEENKENTTHKEIPASWLKQGRFKFRIWLDIDPKSGRPRALKRTFLQRFPGWQGNDFGGFFTPHPEADKMVREAISKKVEGLYAYRSQQVGYVMAQIVSAEYDDKVPEKFRAKEKDRVKPGHDLCIVLNEKGVAALQSLLAEMGREQRAELLDTRRPAPPLEMVLGPNFSCRISVSNDRPYEMQPMRLPEGVKWEGLEKVYVTDDKAPPEEAVHALRALVGRQTLERRQGNNSSRLSDPALTEPLPSGRGENGGSRAGASSFDRNPETPPSYVEEPPFNFGQETPPTLEDNSDDPLNPILVSANGDREGACLLRNNFKDDKEFEAEYFENGFGNKPDKDIPECIMCTREIECRRKTAENNR